MDQEVSLPVEVQTEYNHMLYLALPLCVVLGTGLRDWVESRLVRAIGWCRRGRSGRLFVCADYVDSYLVSELLDPRHLTLADAADISSATEYVRSEIAQYRYVILFTDVGYLRHEPEAFIHELLVYGYDDKHAEILALGFDTDRRFKTLRFRFSDFNQSFANAKAIWISETNEVARPIQTITAPASFPTFDAERAISGLRAHLDKVPIDPVGDYWPGPWWLDHVPRWYVEAEYFFGIDAFTIFSRMADEGPGVKSFEVDYRAFHFLMQHTYGLVRRAERLLALHNIVAPEITARWAHLARSIDAGRLQVLGQALRGEASPLVISSAPVGLWRDVERRLLEETLLLLS